jgi:hypothetical protein
VLGGGVLVPSTTEALQYLEFVKTNYDDLAMLAKADVFVPHFPEGFLYGGTFRADKNTLRVLRRWPASYWDFGRDLPLPDQQTVASFQAYLGFIAATAQQQRAALGAWSLEFHQELMRAIEQLAQGGGPISAKPFWDRQPALLGLLGVGRRRRERHSQRK